MTRVKICGITNPDDLRAAVEAGADAIGFIRVPESPRFVPDDLFHALVQATPPFVTTVAVVRRPSDATNSATDCVQYYEEGESPALPKRRIRAFRVRGEESLMEVENYAGAEAVHAYHLDAYHPGMLGGAGERFDWNLARRITEIAAKPIVLAGGLTPDNVVEAIRQVQPYAVDVSTGVEISPGRKDHAKLRTFIAAVRGADRTERTGE